MDRTPVIVGAADYPLTNGVAEEGATPLRIQARAAQEALSQAGLAVQDVDGLLTTGTWSLTGAGQLMPLTVGEYLGIRPRFVDGTNIGGASFVAYLGHASLALRAGVCDVALITYGSMQRSDRSRGLGGRRAELNMQFETPFGLLSPIGGYALAAARYAHEYGDVREALSSIAVASRQWAAMNPRATKREPITHDDVEASPLISDPLRRLDCCLVTDGGAAVVMTTADNAQDSNRRPIVVSGFAEAHEQWTMTSSQDLTTSPVARTSRRAFTMAGRQPEDMDVVQLYDSFTITVLLALEGLGFCDKGEARDFIMDQELGPGGTFALNTSGGGLSYCHPGMFGLFLVTEAARQLWGESYGAQVPDANTAVVSGIGGALSTGATCILELM